MAAKNAAQTEFTHFSVARNVDELGRSIDEYSPRQPTAKSEKQTKQVNVWKEYLCLSNELSSCDQQSLRRFRRENASPEDEWRSSPALFRGECCGERVLSPQRYMRSGTRR